MASKSFGKPALRDAGADVMAGILRTMATMGVAPLPRNYRLFYDATLGLNLDLSRALTGLGSRPSQLDLDQLDLAYPAVLVAEPQTVANKLIRVLEELVGSVSKEAEATRGYNRLLGEAARHFDTVENPTTDTILKSVHELGQATGNSIQQGQQAVGQISNSAQTLADVYQELETYKQLAYTDAITGLNNRRTFDEQLAHVYDFPETLPLKALMIADIDHFKAINDRFGHLVGDRVLEAMARRLKTLLRRKCFFLARTGGEEFAVIVDGYTKAEVLAAAERVRVLIAGHVFANKKLGFRLGNVTLSIGIAMATQAERPEDLYRAADSALYAAKEDGRNRVVMFDDNAGLRPKHWLIYRKGVHRKS